MMIRRRYPFVAAAAVSAAQQQQVRAVHLPGWKTKQSTKDVRTREQREVDRKIRQIEKLPRPEALHDFQYPHEKMVLADHMFQPPVFETELDTPHLFHVTCPADFFLYWNCADFDRTSYPSVPAVDHRTLIPSFKDTEDSSSRSDGTAAAVDAEKKKTDSSRSETWIEHVALLSKYLEKHQVSPQFFPHVSHEANLAVTFNGLYGWKARRDPDTNAPLPPPPPITDLTRRNFWFTSHAGNYIELCELQDAPAVFFTTAEANDDAYYTLLIASPDYPYRTSPAIDNTKSGGGFFLHYVVSNLRGGHSLDPKRGDVVVPYVPPLPTEDAGTTRHMCILYRQTRKVPNITTLGGKHALAFEDRCNFTLHASLNHRNQHQGSSSLRDVEASLPADPVALTMFQTAWDIQVQEYYESIHQPEPAFQLDEELEAILRYNSLDGKALQINSRHQADGSVNVGMKEHQLVRWQNTQVQRGSMKNLWSRRAYLGTNGRMIVTPS